MRSLAAFNDRVALWDAGVCLCRADETVRFERQDGLDIAAGLYRPSRAAGRPSVLLVHGNTPHGRKLGVYRVLARKLADRGHRTLAIDRTGRGESDDRFALEPVGALDRDADVSAALDFLASRFGAEERILIVGHSGGTASSIRVGLGDPRVLGVVAIGPARRHAERLQDPEKRRHFWRRAVDGHRSVYGTPLPEWYTEEVWIEEFRRHDMETYLPALKAAGHKPVFFIDGGSEREALRAYLARYVERMAEPKRYCTVPDADHYLNTRRIDGVVLYDRRAVGRTVQAITEWVGGLRGRSRARAAPGPCGRHSR